MKTCECLRGVVAISDSCQTTDRCSAYVDSLPGIEKGDLERLTTTYSATIDEIWDKVQTGAIERIRIDLMAKLSDKMSLEALIEDIKTGEWEDSLQVIDNSSEYIGQEIILKSSPNLSCYIDSVDIHLDEISSGSIKVFDLSTGEELYSKAFSDIQGFNTISIQETFVSSRLFICYNADEVSGYSVGVNNLSYYRGMCSPSMHTTPTYSRLMKCSNSGQVISKNLESASDSSMIVNYSIGCTLDKWICKNKNLIIPGLRYLLGMEFFVHVIASKNINMTTLMSENAVDAVVGYCNSNYKRWLKNISMQVNIKDSFCVKCKSVVRKSGILN